jgi:hypothetical protein
MDEVLRTLALLPEKGSIRGVARSTGHDKNAICRWVDLAGSHCSEVTDYYLTELHLDRVQVDEIWSYIKKRYVFSWLASQLTFGGNPFLSVPMLPVSS